MHKSEPAFRTQAIPGLRGPQAGLGELEFDRVVRANVLTVHGREVEEDEQLCATLDQAIDHLGVFVLASCEETIKCLLRGLLAVGLPDPVAVPIAPSHAGSLATCRAH